MFRLPLFHTPLFHYRLRPSNAQTKLSGQPLRTFKLEKPGRAAPVGWGRWLSPVWFLDSLFKRPHFVFVDILPADNLPATFPLKGQIPGPMVILLRYRQVGHETASSRFGCAATEPKQSA